MHRMLLESQPGLIHLFNSEVALDLFGRYPDTFSGWKIVGTLYDIFTPEGYEPIEFHTQNIEILFDIFTKICMHSQDLMSIYQKFMDFMMIDCTVQIAFCTASNPGFVSDSLAITKSF